MLKLFIKLIILFNYVVFILVLIMAGFIAKSTNDCNDYAKTVNPFVLDNNIRIEGVILAIITGVLWLFMHCIGAVIKSLLYVDPFLLNPDDPTSNRCLTLFFKKLGP
jgi:hypothetical protein